MIQPEMAERIDEIVRQARQGSMAALIQLMNEQLADLGVRTRAMFSDGILQILCEAATIEQLDRSQLIPRLQGMLESLAPPNFRRVRINARIAREQQLLWLEEITRDPDNQLLWMQEIAITPPNWFQRLRRQFQQREALSSKSPKLQQSLSLLQSPKRSYWQGLVGGILGSCLILGAGGGVLYWRSREPNPSNLAKTTPPIPVSSTVVSPPLNNNNDAFANAIRMAEDASLEGQTAQTVAQWLDLAAQWQRASDLMATVPPSDTRYAKAQERVILYRNNSEMAQKQADRQKNARDK
ncbi:hypothetical protein [Lusitaniella coriacea]|uniref:hypothetical protein n=1 Tax=Lusitaniella coriacea TaxID=1983105 RepID=UPI003CEB53B5